MKPSIAAPRPQGRGVAKKESFLSELKRYRTLLLMLLPGAVILFVFAYLPMGGVVLAFKQFRYAKGILGSPWTKNIFDNFRFFFLSGKALLVTGNTFTYNLMFIVVNTVLASGFAIILGEIGGRMFRKLTQSVIFLPFFVSWVIVGSIAYNLLNYETGAINGLIKSLNLEAVNFYGTPSAWRWLIVLFNAWKSVGYSMVVYLAAVVGVDAQLNEAAQIDGANIFQRTRHVTLPAILPTMVTLVLLDVSKIFRGNFDLFYQLIGKNGGLFDATDVIDTFVFRSLIQSSDVGMAAAAGLYQSVLCFATILLVNWIVRRVQSDYALF